MNIVILPSAGEDLADGFAFYEQQEAETAFIRAVLDCRRDPKWIRRKLRGAPLR